MLKSSSDNRTIKETGFTGPIVFLSVNVRGPVYFAVSEVMAWCCQATSHYLSKYWPTIWHHISGVTRPQWVNCYTSDPDQQICGPWTWYKKYCGLFNNTRITCARSFCPHSGFSSASLPCAYWIQHWFLYIYMSYDSCLTIRLRTWYCKQYCWW